MSESEEEQKCDHFYAHELAWSNYVDEKGFVIVVRSFECMSCKKYWRVEEVVEEP